MGMTSEQELPLKKTEKSEWSVRRLFPFADVSKAIAKTFTNVFDILLGFATVTLALSELLNRETSVFFYILTILFLFCSFMERRPSTLETIKEVTK